MTVAVPFKRGDTFLLEGVVSINSVAQDITGWTIRAQVRNGAILVEALTVEYTDRSAGKFRLRANPVATELWPVKELDCDIEYTLASGQVVSTETFKVNVKADVTR